MSTKQEVLDAVAAEKESVQAALAAQNAKITALEEQLANGGSVTAADLAEIKEAVKNIFTPA